MNAPTHKGRFVLASLVGALLAFLSAFVYFNMNDLERMAAEADGVPLWSVYQLPFTLPFALAGAALGLGLRWCWFKLRQRA